MRIGVIRSDVEKIYISDVESRVQRDFPIEPPGNSRYVHKPSDDELRAVMLRRAVLTLNGINQAVSVNTTHGNNILRIKLKNGTWQSISVTAGAAVTKVQIANDLNVAFRDLGLQLHARVFTRTGLPIRKFLMIDTVYPSSGLDIPELSIDKASNGSTLNPIVGFTDNATLSALSLTDLKHTLYPSNTVDVSAASVKLLSTFDYMDAAAFVEMWTALAEVVAPEVVFTGRAVWSFQSGTLSHLASSAYKPRGLPTGAAVVILNDDGVTPISF